jgi:S1-C subfamily serine protease
MIRRLVIILSLFILVGVVGIVRSLPDSRPYIVLVRALDPNGVTKWSGSGVFIRKGLILTAGHVVHDTKEFEIILPNGKIRPGFFAYQEDPNLTDMGFIRVRGDYSITHFGKTPYLGQDVWIAGYALAEIPLTLTKGIVSCINRDTDFFGRINLLQIDASSWPGNSGSPVLDKHNHIVGILVGGLRNSDNWSICVSVDVIKLSLAKYDAMEALCNCGQVI